MGSNHKKGKCENRRSIDDLPILTQIGKRGGNIARKKESFPKGQENATRKMKQKKRKKKQRRKTTVTVNIEKTVRGR